VATNGGIHGEEFSEDDGLALVQELAKRAATVDSEGGKEPDNAVRRLNGIVKLFGNGRGAVDVSGWGGER
jgi:hypothetical protein